MSAVFALEHVSRSGSFKLRGCGSFYLFSYLFTSYTNYTDYKLDGNREVKAGELNEGKQLDKTYVL